MQSERAEMSAPELLLSELEAVEDEVEIFEFAKFSDRPPNAFTHISRRSISESRREAECFVVVRSERTDSEKKNNLKLIPCLSRLRKLFENLLTYWRE